MKKGLLGTILSKQNSKRFFSIFLVILMVVTILPLNPAVYAALDEFDILREKYKIQLTGYDPANPYSLSDPYISKKINGIAGAAKTNWDSMNKTTYTWDDVEESSSSNTQHKGTIISRLKTMALGWATPGSAYYNNASLLSDMINGLEWFYANRYNESVNMDDQTWYRNINIPQVINDIIVLLYDKLPGTLITNYMNAINYFVPSVYILGSAGNPYKGANLTDVCKVVGIRAIIVKDSAKLQESSDGLNDVFNYESLGTEAGFLTDGTYIQHWYYPYAGGYGLSLFISMTDMLWLLGGTAWDNTAQNRNNVYEWVFDTFEPVMYKGRIFESVKGRSMSRSNQKLITVEILDGLLKLAEVPSNPHIDTFRSMVKYHLQNGFQDSYFSTCSIWSNLKARNILNDSTITPKAELTGNYQFYNGDRVVHRTPEWTLDLAMHSERIRNYECMSGENLRAWYTADGMTYIYSNPSDYGFNYWPTVDPHRMPGTTVDRDTSRADSTGGGTKIPDKSWVGGVSLEGTYGTAGMDFKQHTYYNDPPSNVNIEAKKSWFMFDDEVVALGSGITSTSGRDIETVFENRAINSQGNNTLTVNGIAKPSSLGWSETMNDVNWIHLDGTGGYVFPDSTQVKGLREGREGEWYDINHLSYDKADDDFNSTTLGGVWQWVREDSTKHALTGEALNITATDGSIAGTTNTTKNILLAAAPQFDFSTDTKLTFSPTATGQRAGLIIYKDDDNYVSISRVRSDRNYIVTESEIGGIRTNNLSSDIYGETVYFKIEKRGSDYLFYASNDGVTWGTALRTYTNAMAGTDGANSGLKMGLTAAKVASSPEITASFDYHHVKVARNYLTLWTDHGIDPENATYSYIILPGKTVTEVESYNGNPNISILKNDTTVQAVKEDTLGIIGANFWGIGNVSYITSYNPAAVMVKDQNNQLEIAVSDPTHEQQQVIVEFGKYGLSVVSKDPAVTVLQQSPTIKLKVDVSQEPGKTYNVTIAYDPLASSSTPEIITTELQPEADSYVRHGTCADTNYGSEALLKTKNQGSTNIEYNLESYMKFDLGTINNAEILSAKLYVYGACSSWSNPVDLNIYGVDDDTWTESGITWNNKPAKGGGLSVLNMTSTMKWQETDITSYVQSQYAGDKKVSLAIARDVATNELTNFNSKENNDNKPYLKVIYVSSQAPEEITKFDPIPDIEAGTAGTAIYADTAAVIAALPSSVTAVSVNNKTVTIPVNAWLDTDGYNPNVAGSYTFTATLGAIPPGYANTGNHAATVEVVVGTVPAPVLQSAVAGDGHVNITWSEVAGSTGYEVYASTVSNSYSVPVTTVAGLVYNYDVTGLTNGTTYYFAVKAVNPGGTSDYSNELSGMPQVAAPGAPVLQSAVAGDGHVNITWSEVTGSTGYEVYASTVSNSYSVPVTTVAGLVYDYDVTGLTNGTTYYFTVKAVNPGGNSDYSNELSATPQVVAPGAPVIQSAVAGDGHVNITWSAVPGSTGYVVYASTVSNSYTEPVETVAGTVYGYDITGLTNGTTYYFAVKAVNPGGNSDYSNELSATPQVAAPGAPVIQSAVAGDGHVNITWSEVTGSTGYEVYASTVSNSYTEPVATVADTVYGYDITGLTNGTTYYFAVKAVNPGGSSDYSNELSAVPQVVAPGAPVIESAVAGDGHVNITWSAVNGSTGYEVYTSTVSNSYSVPVTTVAGFVYDYDVTGLTNGTTYYFAVKATNAGGDSPYSAEISATPKTIPGAPINVMAVAGNAQATVSFTAPLDNGGSLVTEYIVTSNPESITARGTDTSIIVTGLSNGTTYSFTVRAINAAGSSMDSAISNTVTPYTPSNEDDPEDDSNPPANMPEKEQLIPAETGIEMLVNGNTVTMATATTTVIEDKTVTTISIDDKRVEEILQNQSDNALLTLSAKNDSDVVVSRLNAQTVRRMEAAGAVLEIRTENVIYTLPAAQIGIDNVLSQFGGQVELKDITVNIKVSEPPENIIKIIEETANKNNYQIVVKPVEFEIYCTSGDKTVSVSKFNGYIERMVAIPEGVDPGKITTGVVLNPDGTFSHVPTVITVIDGKYYAKISSMTNSTYSVIWNLKSFKDVETHWAKDAVNDMGSRLIINGVSEEIFEPERDTSRAEFATIISKALGLMKPGAGKDVFGDVAKDAWYYDAVSAAYEYGIIAGYGNGKFDPDLKISREQAMVMIARAMEIVKQKVEFSDGEEDKLLENYIDADKSADYAKNSIAACIKTGIVVGRTSNLIAPKDFITRAEAVVIVRRLLQKLGLIN